MESNAEGSSSPSRRYACKTNSASTVHSTGLARGQESLARVTNLLTNSHGIHACHSFITSYPCALVHSLVGRSHCKQKKCIPILPSKARSALRRDCSDRSSSSSQAPGQASLTHSITQALPFVYMLNTLRAIAVRYALAVFCPSFKRSIYPFTAACLSVLSRVIPVTLFCDGLRLLCTLSNLGLAWLLSPYI